MGLDLGARDAEAQGDGLAVLVLRLGGGLDIVGSVAEGIVELAVVAQHLDISAAGGLGQFLVGRDGSLLIEPVLGREVDDVLVVVTIIGCAALRIGLHHAKVELARGELRAHHVDSFGDDLVGRSRHALGRELGLGGEVEFDGLDGCTIVGVRCPPEVEVEVVAHVCLRLAGALDDIFLRGVVAVHHGRGGQVTGIVKRRAGLIHPLIDGLQVESAIALAVHVVEQHHSVAREAETLGQREAHVGGDTATPHQDIEVTFGVETDVAGGVLQHAARREVGLVRHVKREGKLLVAPQGRPAVFESHLVFVGQSRDKVARRG